MAYVPTFLFFLSIAGNGTIDFDEFLTLMVRQMKKIEIEKALKEEFKKYDKVALYSLAYP